VSDFVAEHFAAVRAAADRIKPHVRRTPVLTTDLDPNLRLKPECFQVTGSFKPRGAFNAVLSLMDRERPRGVIAVSSGNHAQAVALAGRTVGIPALILIPEEANPAKVAALKDAGIPVDERVPHHAGASETNRVYLETKRDLLGHLLS